MNEPWFPDAAASRAVLIGVSRYESGELPPIPAVRANLGDLRAALTEPALGSVVRSGCRVLGDDASQAGVGAALAEGSRQASDLLLVYYSGHGLLDDDGVLHLALRSTDAEHPGWTAIPITLLQRELGRARAKARVLVVDCCFSGQAVEAMAAPGSLVTGQLSVTGGYTLASTTANQPSHAPRGARHTAFTGALLNALAAPEPLTLDGIYRHTDDELAGLGLPRPQRRAINTASDVALVRGPVPRRDRPKSAPIPAPRPEPEPAPAARRESEAPPSPAPEPTPTARLEPAAPATPAPHPEPAAQVEPAASPAPQPEPRRPEPAALRPEPTPSPAPPRTLRTVATPPPARIAPSSPGEGHRTFSFDPRGPAAWPLALVPAGICVVTAVIAWIAFTDPYRNVDPSIFEVVLSALIGGGLSIGALTAAVRAIRILRAGARPPATPWTRLEIGRAGVAVTHDGDRREVPWQRIERVTVVRRAPGTPTIMLALRGNAVLPGTPTRKGLTGLGQCGQWPEVLRVARQFAPSSVTVTVDRDVRTLTR